MTTAKRIQPRIAELYNGLISADISARPLLLSLNSII